LPVPADEFRSAMRRWGSGVSILTTRRPGGIQGITVSSFCSLSLRPPLVLACIDKKAGSHALIERYGCFAINILTAGQKRLSEEAAGHLEEHGNWLRGQRYRKAATGAPVLADGLAWLDCSLEDSYDGGDHTIFIGRVEATGYRRGSPLLFFDGSYHRLAARPGRR
jgi:3-hydroxy-9,10-secoandrosta-1,3,5(10)-triene-9,17-dione monooxygenase reductase component